jgi:hypothetical protein
MPETKAHNYAYHGKLDELKAHLSSNPNDVHEKDKVITHTVIIINKLN